MFRPLVPYNPYDINPLIPLNPFDRTVNLPVLTPEIMPDLGETQMAIAKIQARQAKTLAEISGITRGAEIAGTMATHFIAAGTQALMARPDKSMFTFGCSFSSDADRDAGCFCSHRHSRGLTVSLRGFLKIS